MRQVLLAPGEGMSVENPVGGILTFKIRSDESGGSLTALETIAAPAEGPPLHVHDEHELIYTLEGSFRIKLGDTLSDAPPGSFVFIPAGTPHTWQNVDVGPARFFAAVLPAAPAFEQFFTRYSRLPVDERDGESFARLATETEAFRVVGPPLSESDPL